MFKSLRKELNRSKDISKTSNEISSEIRKQYEELDKKYDLSVEKGKLEHMPQLRQRIVRNFLSELKATQLGLLDDRYNKELKKAAIQRFLGKLVYLNDNKKSSNQNA